MATQNDLVRAVLEELTIIGGNEDIDDDDSAYVKRKYTNVHADFTRKFLVDWAITEAIPDDALEPLSLLVAYRCARAFGKQPDPDMFIEGQERLHDYRFSPWLPVPAMEIAYF